MRELTENSLDSIQNFQNGFYVSIVRMHIRSSWDMGLTLRHCVTCTMYLNQENFFELYKNISRFLAHSHFHFVHSIEQ